MIYIEYKSVVILPSLTVVVVSRKEILVFDTSFVNTVGMLEKFIKLFIAMHPLHVNVIY